MIKPNNRGVVHWIKFKFQRFLLWLQSMTTYWRFQYRLKKFQGKRSSLKIRFKSKKEGFQDALNALQTILRQAGWSFVVAVLTAVGVILIGRSEIWLNLESMIGMPSNVEGASARLYGTITSLAGLFVSLYFTAVGFLTSALYGGASSELRSIVLSERISNFYVRFVLWAGAVSLCFLTSEALGYSTQSLPLIIVSIAGIFSLLAAGTLLGGTLRFFNPSSIVAEAHRNLDILFGYFEEGSSLKRQKTLHSILRERARKIIRLFEEALRLCKSENQPIALSEIGGHGASILQSYWNVKLRLPAESGWWQPEPKSEGWFLANYNSINVALQTGTSLRREQELDRLWVERDLSSSLARTLEQLLQQQKWADIARLLDQTRKISGTGGERLLLKEVLLLLSKLGTVLQKHTDSKNHASQDRGVRMSDVWDVYGGAYVQLLIGAKHGLNRIRPENINNLVSTTDWYNDVSVGTTPLMPDMKKRVELLGETLRFERTVEGRSLTPDWYQVEFILPVVLKGLHKRVNLIQSHIYHLTQDVTETLKDDGMHLSACQLAERGLEIQSKWGLFIEKAQEIDKSLRKTIKADDFEYPDFDWKALDEDFHNAEEQAVNRFIGFVPDLSLDRDNEREKELLGHIYSLATDRCAQAVTSGSADRFSELFEQVFTLALFLWGCVPLKAANMRDWDRTRIEVQPILDVMALSGLALVRDEVDGPGFWEPVRDDWSNLLSMSYRPPRELMQVLLTIGGEAVTTFGVAPRFTIRTGWKQLMEDTLRERGILSGYRDQQTNSSMHRPLLNAILGGVHGIEDPIDVLLAALIVMRPESIGLDWPRDARSFLRRWTEKSYR